MKTRLLIVEDEETLRLSLAENLSKKGFEVQAVDSGEQAIKLWTHDNFDLILLDVKLPGGMDGIEILEKIRQVDQTVLVIMMTAFGDVAAAVRAMKLGAYDYINKPFMLDEMILVLRKAMETRNLRDEVAYLRREQQERTGGQPLVSRHPKMEQVFEMVERVAGTPHTSVLIQGESGTGKELIAQFIHNKSDRNKKPLVKIDCSTISETLMESELFGHKRGAFTDAREDKKGLFEHADGGTVFLDEIGEMKLSLQPKLLQILENQTLRRVGDLRDIKIDVRVVAATNRDLFAMAQDREFREDLYYRLKVMLVELPPLRERIEDVIPLAEHFIYGFNREFRKNITAISPAARKMLTDYAWPGNVRELKNAVERAVILTDGELIEPHNLPLELDKQLPAADELTPLMDSADKSLEELEHSYINCVLQKTNGNKSAAADILGISRSTLWQKLKKYDPD